MKKIRETQQSEPAGMMRVVKTLVRVRELQETETVPDGAVIVPNSTETHDWKEVEN